MSWRITPTQLLVDDQDALTYLAAVEAADGQTLEPGVRLAVNAFVKDCKADGIWPAIKASCILAGARTLTGALVPLVGAAPTNVGGLFVSGDYNRETGLVGNGSSKYLNSNRNNNADPQNNQHLAVYHNSTATGLTALAGSADGTGTSQLIARPAPQTKSRNNTGTQHGGSSVGVGLFGISRSSASTHEWRASGGLVGGSITQTSEAPAADAISIFARGAGSIPTASRLAFYSIGESLNLALLDARVTTLINALSAAIP